MPTDDAIAVGRAVHARMQQIPAHKVVGIGDGVRARSGLAVGGLLRGNRARRNDAVAGRGSVGLTPPRLVEATGVVGRRRTTIRRATKVITLTVSPVAAASTTTAGAATATGATTALGAATTATRILVLLLLFVVPQSGIRTAGLVRDLALHDATDRRGAVVHHVDDALRRSLALLVRLLFDGGDVGGTGRVELAHEADTRTGLAGGNRHEQVIAHGRRVRIEEVRRELFSLRQRRRHHVTASRIGAVAALVALPILLDTGDGRVNPAIHGSTRRAGKAVALAIGTKALNGVIKALQGLVVIPVPRVKPLVGASRLHEDLKTLIIR